MTSKTRIAAIALSVIVVAAATAYVFMTPYNRIAGVRIGGDLTPPPANWNEIRDDVAVAWLKTGGFPPFVVNVLYSTDFNGIITASRPDGGFWGRQTRINPHGWIRVGDKTYSLQATEITGDARIPYLESYGGKNNMPMRYDFEGEIIRGTNEPLHTWEVFYWTPR